MFKRKFTDFDEFASQAEQWDLELKQLDAGPFQAENLQFWIGDVQISDAHFACERIIKQGGAPPSGLRTIVIPAHQNFEFEWRGARVDGNSLMVFPLGSGFEGLSKSNFHVFTCSFPEWLLENAASSLGVASLADLDRDVVRCSAEQASIIRRFLRQLCTRICDDQALLAAAEFSESVTQELPQLLLGAAASADHDTTCSVTATKRMRILKCAEDYIDQRAGEDELTVGEVCGAVQTSLRTLQLAFAERYGISPKAYIRAIRLNRARKQLRSADPGELKVADIANGCGFWHMGQFAADYRRQFGELPSATLHSGR